MRASNAVQSLQFATTERNTYEENYINLTADYKELKEVNNYLRNRRPNEAECVVCRTGNQKLVLFLPCLHQQDKYICHVDCSRVLKIIQKFSIRVF